MKVPPVPAPAPTGYEWRGGAWDPMGGFWNEFEAPHQTIYRLEEWQWWLLPTQNPPGTPLLNQVQDVWRHYGEDVARNSDLVSRYGIDHWPPVQSDRGQGGLELAEDVGAPEVVIDPGPPQPFALPPLTPLLPPPDLTPMGRPVLSPAPAPEGAPPVRAVPLTPILVSTPARAVDTGSFAAQLTAEFEQLLRGTHPDLQDPEVQRVAPVLITFIHNNGIPALVQIAQRLLSQSQVAL